MTYQEQLLEQAVLVMRLREELARAENRFNQLSMMTPQAARTGSASPPTLSAGADSVSPGSGSVAERVRTALKAGPMDFPTLYSTVTRSGPAGKFAVRSALGKAREKKQVKYTGKKYSLT